MTIAPYGLLNNTAQTGSAYKNGIDNNSVAALRIVARFAPHAQTSPNMTIMIDAGSLFDGTTLTEKTAQTTATITAPISHPRIDRVVIDNVTGNVSVIAGAEAVSPTPPAITSGKSPVAQILLQTTTTAITNAIITDERNFAALSPGGFGAQSSISSAATCDLGSILSRNVMITGMTKITSFGSSAATTSPIYLIEFASVLTLTNGSGLLLPGGANIVTAAGDTGIAEYLGSGNWRVRQYTYAAGASSTDETEQYLYTSGIYTTPAGCKKIKVRMVGGGGGGGGYGSGRSDGGPGGATNFGNIYASGGGGGGGYSSAAYAGAGGTGGSGTAYRQNGQAGSFMGGSSTTGGNSRLGWGAAGTVISGQAPSADANSGGGGAGGASVNVNANSSGSGGGGEYTKFYILNPAATYTFTIGSGGIGGSGGTSQGGNGGTGYIEVTEFY